MSYILEALQESQKNRDDARVPNLRSVHVEPKETSHVGNKRLAYLALVGVLIVASLGTFWWKNGSEPSLELEPPLSSGALQEIPPAEVSAAETSAIAEVGALPDVEVYETAIKDPAVDLPTEKIPVLDNGDIDAPGASVAAGSIPALKLPPVKVEEAASVNQSTVTNSVPRPEPVVSSVQPASKVQEAKVTELVAAPTASPPSRLTQDVIMNDDSPSPLSSKASEPPQGFTEAPPTTDELAIEKLPSEQVALVAAPPSVQAMETQVVARDQSSISAEDLGAQMQQSASPPVPHFRQLPFDVQQSLPTIAYSVHLYAAEPAHRMVKIDGRVRREGDTVKPGLVLEEITPTGAVFSFRDNVFRVPVNG